VLICNLAYIPEILHTNSKPIVNIFTIGEELYYRTKSEEVKKPYDKISLYDISHNRNFNNSIEYLKEYVLFNIDENDIIEKYDNREIVTLKINQLQKKETYQKEIISREDDEIRVLITLKHRPELCMYPHSVFEITFNDTIVDKTNYGSTIGKDNKLFSNIRSDIRQELTSIIQSGIIDSSQGIEIIEIL
jgi:hypothetical protein